jgi:S-adenosylmethionine synthetase
MARYIAKNIVAAGLARCAEVQLAYAIGVANPVSVTVSTEGTAVIPEDQISQLIRENFPLTPRAIIKHLDLLRPIYKQTARHGHFGRIPTKDGGFSWEKTDRAEQLAKAAGIGTAKNRAKSNGDAATARKPSRARDLLTV